MDFYIIQYRKCLDTYYNLCLNLTFRGCKYMPKTKKYMVIVESLDRQDIDVWVRRSAQ